MRYLVSYKIGEDFFEQYLKDWKTAYRFAAFLRQKGYKQVVVIYRRIPR